MKSIDLRIIGASAGSGKTTRVAEEIKNRLTRGEIRAEAIVATTFTRKAAGELRHRIVQALLDSDRGADAEAAGLSLIGTVNSVCGQILQRFAFEAGLSPAIEVIDEAQESALLAEIMAGSVTQTEGEELRAIWDRCQAGYYEFITTWQDTVSQIMTAARINAIEPEELAECKLESIESLLKLMPAPSPVSPAELDAELRRLCEDTERLLKAADDGVGVTTNYLDRLRKAIGPLGRGTLNWQAWAGLSANEPGAASRSFAQPVIACASRFLTHPRLHSDLRRSIELAFDIAARCLSRYQAEKQARNLIDFVDQERLTHDMLRDKPSVRDALRREIDLVIVDEFQDTSPLQLAIFVQLAGLAKSSVWVGDPKQAIYDFRGTDPRLMQATLDQLARGPREQLQNSYRTRPGLVRFTNAIFARAFSAMEPEQVRLTPTRQEPQEQTDAPPLIHWKSGKRDGKAIKGPETVAAGIYQMLHAGKTIVDRETVSSRPLRAGDVAVLCRTNNMAVEVAQALREHGVAASQPRPGLLDTREGGILHAAVRRYAARYDLSAALDLALLSSQKPDPEGLLESRLRFMEEDRYGDRWLTDDPHVAAVDTLPDGLSILEAVEIIIERLQLRWIAASFHFVEGEVTGRIANIEAFRALASRYEELCAKLLRAATPGGFVIWLSEIRDDSQDLTAADPGDNSVRVLTIHGAKGLEWPVVISVQLDADPRVTLWGVTVQSKGAIDSRDPLKGRSISYWPSFLSNTTNFAGNATFFASDTMKQREARAADENKRLQYVNFTRARDCQIVLGSKFLSLKDFLPEGKFPGASGEWDVFGENVSFLVETIDPVDAASGELAFHYFAPRPKPSPRPPAILLPSAMESIPANVAAVKEYGTRLNPGNAHDETLGNALHAFLAMDFAQKRADRLKLAALALARYSLSSLDPASVVKQSELLHAFLVQELGAVSFAPEIPVQAMRDGQLLKGQIDLVVETASGLVLIDHKSFRGNRPQWEKKALEYSGQLAAYSDALEIASGKKPRSLWINFFSTGAMVRIEV